MILEVERDGRSYRIHDPGGLMAEALHEGLPYEHRLLRYILSKGYRGKAVDVGASVGNHTLWLAAICELEVIAVEPLDVQRLRANVDLNPGLPITVWPVALGDQVGRESVTGPPAHVTGLELDDDETVPVCRLDEFGLTNVCLIKIDVEGMEPQVLRGAQETICRTRPALYVEAVDAAARKRNAAEIPRGYVRTRTFGATPLDEWQWQG